MHEEVRPDRVMRAEAGAFERAAADRASKSYAVRRAEILFDLDRRTRARAEAPEMHRRYGRTWRWLTRRR